MIRSDPSEDIVLSEYYHDSQDNEEERTRYQKRTRLNRNHSQVNHHSVGASLLTALLTIAIITVNGRNGEHDG